MNILNKAPADDTDVQKHVKEMSAADLMHIYDYNQKSKKKPVSDAEKYKDYMAMPQDWVGNKTGKLSDISK